MFKECCRDFAIVCIARLALFLAPDKDPLFCFSGAVEVVSGAFAPERQTIFEPCILHVPRIV